MIENSDTTYKETIVCDPSVEQGLVFINGVAMPYEDAVEFDVKQARSFAQRILAAVAKIESGWVNTSSASDASGTY